MVFLHLYHGRSSKDEQLEDWGTEGPTFGPLAFVHTTYGDHIKFEIDNTFADLHVDGDMVYYDGVWYGDWTVFASLPDAGTERDSLVAYDPEKARVPASSDPAAGGAVAGETTTSGIARVIAEAWCYDARDTGSDGDAAVNATLTAVARAARLRVPSDPAAAPAAGA